VQFVRTFWSLCSSSRRAGRNGTFPWRSKTTEYHIVSNCSHEATVCDRSAAFFECRRERSDSWCVEIRSVFAGWRFFSWYSVLAGLHSLAAMTDRKRYMKGPSWFRVVPHVLSRLRLSIGLGPSLQYQSAFRWAFGL
jgi:hypothetical protein